MSTYDELRDEIAMAEATGTPVVLVTAHTTDGETMTEVHSVNAPVYAVVGLLSLGLHIVQHDEEVDEYGD